MISSGEQMRLMSIQSHVSGAIGNLTAIVEFSDQAGSAKRVAAMALEKLEAASSLLRAAILDSIAGDPRPLGASDVILGTIGAGPRPKS